MNALSASPRSLTEDRAVEQFFQDLGRWGFDIACIRLDAHWHVDPENLFADTYTAFSAAAAAQSLPACVSIDISQTLGDVVDISEAQHHFDDRPVMRDGGGFFVSFASKEWQDHLKGIIKRFVEDFGFNFVLLGAPIYRVDIPGRLDRFYKAFLKAHPNLDYPHMPQQSAEYLTLQKLKTDIAMRFCGELANYAKSIGAEIVGVTARPFAPGVGSTTEPHAQMNVSDAGRLFSLPDVDFGAVQLRPDLLIRVGEMIGEPVETRPCLSFAEVLSAAAGKPIVVVTQGAQLGNWPANGAISPETLSKSTLAAITAAPNGIVAGWEEMNAEPKHHSLITTAAEVLPRMVHQRSPLGFIYSGSSTVHADTTSDSSVWSHYWPLMRRMLVDVRRPVLTLTADALQEQIALNPQLRMAILDEHFPLTRSQVRTLLDWWQEQPGRSLVVFGSGLGRSADPNVPGPVSIEESFPGLLEQIGVKIQNPPSVDLGPDGALTMMLRGSKQVALPEDGTTVRTSAIANVHRIFGSGCSVLYTDTNGQPIITRWRTGDTVAYFCGVGSSHDTAQLLTSVIRQAAISTFRPPVPPVISSTGHYLWNGTTHGYLIVGNCCSEQASVTVARRPYAYWDVLERRLEREESIDLVIPPDSLKVIRWIPKTAKLYDIAGAISIKSISAGAGRAEVVLRPGPNTQFIVRSVPKRLLIDGVQSNDRTFENCGPDHCTITLTKPLAGEHTFTLIW